MKKLFIVLFIIFVVINSVTAQSLQEQANNAYSTSDYERAAQLYKEVIEKEGESAYVYYNLGNTYYRLNEIAFSILYYERSLLLDPANKDARFNLEIAKLKTVDKIEPIGEFFITEWFNDIRNLFNTDLWSYISVMSFLLFIACLFLFFFSRKIVLKKIGFFSGLVLIIVCIFSNVFAYNQKKKLLERNSAIIFSPTTTIKSSPDASGTDLFILHEGTKVLVTNKLGEWNEIETQDGNVGWIKTKEIEII